GFNPATPTSSTQGAGQDQPAAFDKPQEQVQQHWFEEAAGYEVQISKGFTELKPSAYSYAVQEPPADYRISPPDKSNMGRYLFGGFEFQIYHRDGAEHREYQPDFVAETDATVYMLEPKMRKEMNNRSCLPKMR
ncbi:MAG TPA: hypothetical protein VES73_10645, partial [Lamprocystis sp. (in: g-proteobacteria)]|nr:hypothetical protein [Lamprocystis sp. (in: g-proteobacteria)]